MGDFLPTRSSPRIPLLGLSGWNNHKLVTTGGPYTRGGVFVDAFAVPSGPDVPWELDANGASFVQAFRDSLARTPTALEAVTSDVGGLVAAIMRTRPGDRLQKRRVRPGALRICAPRPGGWGQRAHQVGKPGDKWWRSAWVRPSLADRQRSLEKRVGLLGASAQDGRSHDDSAPQRGIVHPTTHRGARPAARLGR